MIARGCSSPAAPASADHVTDDLMAAPAPIRRRKTGRTPNAAA